MADLRPIIGTGTSLTVTGLSTLASATYVASATMTHVTNDPEDVIVEVTVATTNTPSVATNRQVVVFAQCSHDGTNWSSGPTSGTTTNDEPDLYLIGVLPVTTATNTHRRQFSLAAGFGGFLPKYSRLVLKNDLGVALTSGSATYAELQRSIV